jgi:hypothetical protein
LLEEIIPRSKEYKNFEFVLKNEWLVDENDIYKGKGDLILSDGAEIILVELKIL